MTTRATILAKDSTAAAMLDMKIGEFRERVAADALPAPIDIMGLKRWRVDQLRAIVSGEASRTPEEDFEM